MKLINYVCYVLAFTILTLISQIGGIVYIVASMISRCLKSRRRMTRYIVFVALYCLSTFLIVPPLAKLCGREKITCNDRIKPANFIINLLNRNYVTPELNAYLNEVSRNDKLKRFDVEVRYLDACFPFIDGFPLLPHLSHNDGRKIDLSFIYEDKSGQVINKSKSVSGYGVFEPANESEIDQTEICLGRGFSQYDYPKYFTLGRIHSHLQFSNNGTAVLIQSLLETDELEKMFIEPHIKQRLGFNDSRIRFQGCYSVRHDDHIHLQVKKRSID